MRAIKFNKDSFLLEIEKLHGLKYEYLIDDGALRYSDAISFICPIHGIQTQTMGNHLQHCNCLKCSNIAKHNKHRWSGEEFIEKATIIHNGLYTYNNVEYINSRTKVTINCSKHGDFKQTPTHHILGGGCPKCAIERSRVNKKLTTEDFINKASHEHNNKYDYSDVEYVNNAVKITIICPHHGKFIQAPGNHTQGDGCPKCARELSGYSRSTWKTQAEQSKNFDSFKLYLIRVFSLNTGEEFYKIGITFSTISKRFNNGNTTKLPYSYEVIDTIEGSSEYIYDLENELHRKYKHLSYMPNIKFKGCGECYVVDNNIVLK